MSEFVFNVRAQIEAFLSGPPRIPFHVLKHNNRFNPDVGEVEPIRGTAAEIRALGVRETWYLHESAPGITLFVDRHDVPRHIRKEVVVARQKRMTVRVINPTAEGLREQLVACLDAAGLGQYAQSIQYLRSVSTLVVVIDGAENFGDVTGVMRACIEAAKQKSSE